MSSRPIDQAIVQLSLDNENFEKNATQSLETFAKMNQEFSKGENIDLRRVADGVDAVNEKFTLQGTIVRKAYDTIANYVVGAGTKLMGFANNFLGGAIKDGFREYESIIDMTKVLKNSAVDLKGNAMSIKQINEQLDDLNDYSDKTIYSFKDMVSNITKFTNQGIPLERAAQAMKGISNLAALSGANSEQASRAMYNIAQALGGGAMRKIDWNSIKTATMDTMEFKNELLKTALALGTVVKQGDKFISTTTNARGKVSEAFDTTVGWDDSLQHMWMTNEVLTKTLEVYGDESTELGAKAWAAAKQINSFSKLMDTVTEGIGSNWAQIFRTVIGNLDQAEELWTSVNGVIEGFVNSTLGNFSEVVKAWAKFGGRDDLLKGLEMGLKAVGSLFEPVIAFFTALLPSSVKSAGKLLYAFTNGFKVAMTNLYNILTPIASALKPLAVLIAQPFKIAIAVVYRLYLVLSRLLDYGSKIIRMVVETVAIVSQLTRIIVQFGVAMIKSFVPKPVVKFFASIYKGFRDCLKFIGTFLDKMGNAFTDTRKKLEAINGAKLFSTFVKEGFKFVVTQSKNVAEAFRNVAKSVGLMNTAIGSALSGGVNKLGSLFGKLIPSFSKAKKGSDSLNQSIGDSNKKLPVYAGLLNKAAVSMAKADGFKFVKMAKNVTDLNGLLTVLKKIAKVRLGKIEKEFDYLSTYTSSSIKIIIGNMNALWKCLASGNIEGAGKMLRYAGIELLNILNTLVETVLRMVSITTGIDWFAGLGERLWQVRTYIADFVEQIGIIWSGIGGELFNALKQAFSGDFSGAFNSLATSIKERVVPTLLLFVSKYLEALNIILGRDPIELISKMVRSLGYLDVGIKNAGKSVYSFGKNMAKKFLPPEVYSALASFKKVLVRSVYPALKKFAERAAETGKKLAKELLPPKVYTALETFAQKSRSAIREAASSVKEYLRTFDMDKFVKDFRRVVTVENIISTVKKVIQVIDELAVHIAKVGLGLAEKFLPESIYKKLNSLANSITKFKATIKDGLITFDFKKLQTSVKNLNFSKIFKGIKLEGFISSIESLNIFHDKGISKFFQNDMPKITDAIKHFLGISEKEKEAQKTQRVISGIGNSIIKANTDLSHVRKQLSDEWLKEGKSPVSKIAEENNKDAKKLSSSFETLKNVFDYFANNAGSRDLLKMGGIAIGFLLALRTFKKLMKNFFALFDKTTKETTKEADNTLEENAKTIRDVFKKPLDAIVNAVSGIGTGLKRIGTGLSIIGIGIILHAVGKVVKALQDIDKMGLDRAREVAVTLGGVIFAIGLAFRLAAQGMDAKVIWGIAATFLAIGISIKQITKAIMTITDAVEAGKDLNLAVGLILGITTLLTIIIAFAQHFGTNMKGTASVIAAIGFAVVQFTFVVMLLSLMKDHVWAALGGIAGLTVILAALAVAINIAGQVDIRAAGTVMAIGFAVINLVFAVMLLSKLNSSIKSIPKMASALMDLALIMIGIVAAVKVLDGVNANKAALSMIAFSVAINALIIPLMLLTALNTGKLLGSAAALFIAVIGIAAAMSAMSDLNIAKSAAGIILVSGAILMLTYSVQSMQATQIGALAGLLIGFAAALFVVAIVGSSLTGAALGLLAFSVAMVAVGVAATGIAMAIDSFANAIERIANIPTDKLRGAGKNLILGLAEGVGAAVMTLISKIGEIAKSCLEAIMSIWQEHSPSKKTEEMGENFVNGLTQGIGNMASSLPAKIGEMATKALAYLSEHGDELANKAFNMIAKFASAAISAIQQYGPGIASGVVTFVAKIASAIVQNIPGVVAAFGKLLLAAGNWMISTGIPKMAEIGMNLIKGLAKGIADFIVSLPMLMFEVGKAILTSLAQALGIASPSTKAAEIGKNVILGLVNGLKTFVTSIPTVMLGIAKSIIDGLASIVPDGVQKALEWGQGVIGAIGGAALGAGTAAVNVAKSITTGIGGIAQAGFTKAQNFVGSVAKVISGGASTVGDKTKGITKSAEKNIAPLATKGREAADKFATGIASKIKSGASASAKASKSLATTVVKMLQSMKSNGSKQAQQFAKAVTSAIRAGIATASAAAKSMGKSVVNGVKSTITGSSIVSVGKNLAAGLARGIKSGASAAINAAKSMMRSAVAAAKAAANIKSPSRVMMGVGEFFTEGMAIGISNATGDAIQSASDMMTKVIDSVQNNIDDSLTFEPQINPILNMEEIDRMNAILANVPINGNIGFNQNGLQNGAVEIAGITVNVNITTTGKESPQDIARIAREQAQAVITSEVRKIIWR